MVGVEERGEPVQQGAVLAVLLLPRVEHLLLQLPHDADDVLPVPGEPALPAAPLVTVQAGVGGKDGATTVLTQPGTQVRPQLGGVGAADTATREEPAGRDIRTPTKLNSVIITYSDANEKVSLMFLSFCVILNTF